jgi:hypothetical protein
MRAVFLGLILVMAGASAEAGTISPVKSIRNYTPIPVQQRCTTSCQDPCGLGTGRRTGCQPVCTTVCN